MTSIAAGQHWIHEILLWVSVVICIVVFGAMFYSIFAFRRSKGAKAGGLPREHGGRGRLDHRAVHHRGRPRRRRHRGGHRAEGHLQRLPDGQGHRLPVEVGLRVPATARARESTSCPTFRRTHDQINNQAPKNVTYLMEVDNPLVVPVNKKVRVVVTADDVIHAWGVPALRRQAGCDPRLRARHLVPRRARRHLSAAQCYELCGKDHAFMPIVVEVKSEADYKAWVDEQRKKEMLAKADDPNKEWDATATWSRAARRSTRPTASPATRRPARACRGRSRRSTSARRCSGRRTTRSTSCSTAWSRTASRRRWRRSSSSPTRRSPRSSPTPATAGATRPEDNLVQPKEIAAARKWRRSVAGEQQAGSGSRNRSQSMSAVIGPQAAHGHRRSMASARRP